MLPDDDPRKWMYRPHTRAKHAVLRRYMKAWLAIFGRAAHRSHLRARVVIVDAFAGRGRYESGEPGSPLILRELAARSFADRDIDQADLVLIEANPDNHNRLSEEVTALAEIPGLNVHLLDRSEFAIAADSVLSGLRRTPRPSFWFIDPFGFAGVPLTVIGQIMALPHAEAFINFMARDINRFLEEHYHTAAIREMFGLSDEQYAGFIRSVINSDTRVASLREAYEERLRAAGNCRFIWSYRVAEASADDTVYYLLHASNHIKAFREMKDATHAESASGQFAYLGRDDFGAKSQLPLFEHDPAALQTGLLEVFAGRTISFDELCDAAYPNPRLFRYVESDFRRALHTLVAEAKITKIAVTTKTPRGLAGKDELKFPR